MKTIISLTNNFTPGRSVPIKYGVIHSVSLPPPEKNCFSTEHIISYLKSITNESYHYLIGREGAVIQMVNLKDTAWHCKESVIAMPKHTIDIDPASIGIVLVGSPTEIYTSKQYEVLTLLVNEIEAEVMKASLGFIEHWVGHDWVSGEVAHRMGFRYEPVKDPGSTFDWEIFNKERYRNKLLNELSMTWKAVLSKEVEESWSAWKHIKKGLCKIFH